MSATIMSEAEATTLHLQLHMQQRSTATTLTWPNAFRSLISYAATDAYGDLTRFKLYPIRHVDSGHKGIGPLRASSYEPFLSDERCLWLFDSFTEEKAHRHAIQVSGQAHHIVGAYCQPTLTRHHRCGDSTCEVVSLGEFLRGLSPELHARYVEQARFLVNHLRSDERDRLEPRTSRELAELLNAPSRPPPSTRPIPERRKRV